MTRTIEEIQEFSRGTKLTRESRLRTMIMWLNRDMAFLQEKREDSTLLQLKTAEHHVMCRLYYLYTHHISYEMQGSKCVVVLDAETKRHILLRSVETKLEKIRTMVYDARNLTKKKKDVTEQEIERAVQALRSEGYEIGLRDGQWHFMQEEQHVFGQEEHCEERH